MSTEIAIRPSWWSRLFSLFTRAEASSGHPLPVVFEAGSDYVQGVSVWPELDPNTAMSAYAVFPWLYAAGSAVSSDLSGLPLILMQGKGKAARRIESHPVLDLFNSPSSRMRGQSVRAQMCLDRCLPGNAYGLLLGGDMGRQPTSIIRMHPERVRPIPDTDGQPLAYVYDGAGNHQTFPWDAVLHVAGPSWEDGAQGLYGTGWIRSLIDQLNAESSAWRRQANAQKLGRPDAIISPDGEAGLDRWDPAQMKVIRKAVDKIFADVTGGIAVLPDGMKMDTLSWSPANLESGVIHADVQKAVKAVCGVPPARLSEDAANFATYREQMTMYWDCTVRGFAREFDSAWTSVARRWEPNLWVKHDFSGVAALRHQRTDAINRAQALWFMGIPRNHALAVEGLDEAIPEAGTEVEPEAPADEPADAENAPELDRGALALADWLSTKETAAGTVLALAPQPEQKPKAWARPETEAERTVYWKGFIDDLHGPGERKLSAATLQYLRASAVRMADRMGQTLGKVYAPGVQKEYSTAPATIEAILDAGFETEQIKRTLGPKLLEIAKAAFLRAAAQVGTDLEWNPETSAVETHLDKLSPQVLDTTRKAIERVILDGNEVGASIAEMQAALVQVAEFSPARALRVARTETTRQANASAVQAFADAEREGVTIKKEWITARNGGERHPSYPGLDGQVRAVGEEFEVGDAHGMYPGDTGVASEDINCMCTCMPYIED